MAALEETELLRIVSLLSVLTASAVLAEETPPVEFAPGAQGGVAPPIMGMLDEARRLGESWQDSLDIQGPDDFGRSIDMDALRDRALADPRVRALLHAGEQDVGGVTEEARYGNSRVFLLASFSMPEQVLRTMMVEANALDVPIIFKGFVDNSVYKTQSALERVFGEDLEIVGFNIDPTIYTRFDIKAVPQVIVLKEELEPCETPGCLSDPAPLHDRVGGNIPLRAALEIIALGDGDAPDVARHALGMGAVQ